MDQYDILKTVHKVGHPISSVVIGYHILDFGIGWKGCHIEMKTASAFKSILPYHNLFDEYDYDSHPFDETLLPAIGSQVDMVVMNYVDGTLYLSAKPKDVNEQQMADFVNFYKVIENLHEGEIIAGQVAKAVRFGLFIKLPFPYVGLIEILNKSFSDCERLPHDPSKWPKEGEAITCRISSFRFWDKQIDLCWLPASSAATLAPAGLSR